MRNQVQLITYPDRLAGDLPALRRMLDDRLAGLFGGVHVLPFFHRIDGADAGFDPIDHREVDARIGGWADIAALGADLEVCADLIVNHVSDAGPWFTDLAARGEASPYAGMFLTYDTVFPDGATEADLLRIYRPRPGLPFTPALIAGRPRLLWTTFTPHQLDLDVRHPAAWNYLLEVLDRFAAHGVALVRLDAVGYAVKTAGTTCFMTPQTLDFVADLTAVARDRGLQVLVEVHAHYQSQVEIARQVDLVYDFALPPLVLHAVHTGDVDPLLHWLDVRPRNAITVLDTHDGIGIVDVGADQGDPSRPGLLAPAQLTALVEALHRASGGTSLRATGAAARNLDVYQVNCTWYDAVGRDDRAFLITRLIQLMTPGVPQVYYVGLLAGGNDLELLAQTGNGRDINRHRYTPAEVEQALSLPVVAAGRAAIQLRNTHPAFHGRFECGPGQGPGSMRMRWDETDGDGWVELVAAPAAGTFTLSWTGCRPPGEAAPGEAAPGEVPICSVSTVEELSAL